MTAEVPSYTACWYPTPLSTRPLLVAMMGSSFTGMTLIAMTELAVALPAPEPSFAVNVMWSAMVSLPLCT